MTVVIPPSVLKSIRHLLTPGGLDLPSEEETRKLVESVAALCAPLRAAGRDQRVPSRLTLPIFGTVTHLVCWFASGKLPRIGVTCEDTGRSLHLEFRTNHTDLMVVGASLAEATTADASQPVLWGFAEIDDVESRYWSFLGDVWTGSLMATRSGTDPWIGFGTLAIHGVERMITPTGRFEDVRDVFDALMTRVPAAVPERAWLPDSRLPVSGHERVRVPREMVDWIAGLLVPSSAPLPHEREVDRLIRELIRIGAPCVRFGGEFERSLGGVSLPVLGAAQTALIEEIGPRSTITVTATDGTTLAIHLENMGRHAEVCGAEYSRPPTMQSGVEVVAWGYTWTDGESQPTGDADDVPPSVETLTWKILADGAPRLLSAERRTVLRLAWPGEPRPGLSDMPFLGLSAEEVEQLLPPVPPVAGPAERTNWTSDQHGPIGEFETPRALFEAAMRALTPPLPPEHPGFPDSRLRD